jgi:RNA polymerase-binding transcription factor DksA
MTRGGIEVYRRKLLDLVHRLRGDLSELRRDAFLGWEREAGGGLSSSLLHPVDLATETCAEELGLDLLGNEEQLLAEVDAALTRIDQGTFGRCEKCAKEIARARLLALPYARCCRACAEQDEQSDA